MEQNERTQYQRGYDLALNSMANGTDHRLMYHGVLNNIKGKPTDAQRGMMDAIYDKTGYASFVVME
jgi:hypothetical protein